MKRKRLLMTIFLFFATFFATAPLADVSANGLVPCGGNGEPRCRLCHLIVGVDNIIDWGRNILVFVALASLVAGGIMYIISAGNQQLMETAKNIVKQSLIGFAIVLGAWLIVNASLYLIFQATNTDGQFNTGPASGNSWYEFSCPELTSGGLDIEATHVEYPAPADGSTSSGTTVSSDNQLTQAELDEESAIREFLRGNGVNVNHNNPCQPGQTEGCTDLRGLSSGTINDVIEFSKDCESCNIIISSGSEAGHASHDDGQHVDIRRNNQIDSYIRDNFEFIGNRTDDSSPVYTDGNGNYYAEETGGTYGHYHICYGDCTQPPVN